MEQFDWMSACFQDVPPGQAELTIVQRNGALVAAALFSSKKIHGVSHRVMPGVEEYYEPTQFLAADHDALERLVQHLARRRSPLICGRLPANSPTVSALQQAFGRRGTIHVRPEKSWPGITLDASWSSPESHLNSGRRSDLRRARRRAEELGPLETEILRPAPEDLDRLLDIAFQIEEASWKGDAGTALSTDAARGAFYRRYAHAACRRGALRVCFLKIDGQPVAMQLAVVQSNRFWLLKIGYDSAFARCSPGLLLIRETIAHSVQEGLVGYEFLGTSESWTEVWTKDERACVSLTAYPRSVIGAAALAAKLAHHGALKSRQTFRSGSQSIRTKARAGLTNVMKRAARGYIAGDALPDAQRVCEQFHRQNFAATVGYWDAEGESPRQVADEYLAGLELLGHGVDRNYLSIKLPSLGGSAELLQQVADKARTVGRRIHFDALGPEQAETTRTSVDQLITDCPALAVSYTLPGRWRRSREDADWVNARQLPVRVVKGQWADPVDPDRDLRLGFLEVIDHLAGKARHVCVATHDAELSVEAIRRLRNAGTPCEIELLYGLPMQPVLRFARREKLPVRIYVPYGAAYLPYAVSKLKSNRRVLWWLLRDAAAAALRR